MTPNPELRVGDAERDVAAASLGEHFAAGRLTRQEYDERSDLALQARTQAQLDRLFGDLPGASSAPRTDQPPSRRRPHPPSPWLARIPWVPLLVLLVVFAVLPHAPFLPLVLLGCLWFFGPWRHRARPHHHRW